MFNFEGLLVFREIDTFIYGGIAQLVEHLLCKQGVIGSNPFTSTTEEKVVGEARERMGS